MSLFLHLESEPEGRTLIPVQSQCPNNNSPERQQTKVKITDREDQCAMPTFFPQFYCLFTPDIHSTCRSWCHDNGFFFDLSNMYV